MRGLLGMAAASSLGVAVTTLAIRGWNSGGAHAAARNTARFSCLWFVAAFAAPGVARLVHGLPVAARLVQFAVVAALIASFERAHLAQKPGQSAAVLLIGFSLVVGLGITATSRTSRLYTAVNRGMLYLIFLIFFFAFVHNAVKPVRLLAVLLALALLSRLATAAQNLWNPANT